MFESTYWKEELLRIARSIRKLPTPPRWSERLVCTTERDITVGFFLLRRLIELNKVSSKTRDYPLSVYSCGNLGRNVTLLNNHKITELYELDKEVAHAKKTGYVANQFIHAYTCFLERDESRNWSDVYVISDFDRNDCIWRVPVEEIRSIFRIAAGDYPTELGARFDHKKRDFRFTTN